MDWLQSLILGVVEGLTEYLPVSSTAHLLLAQRAFGIGQSEASDAYAICIQSGAILAVLGIYARRVRQMLVGLMGGDPVGQRLALQIVIAFLPAAVVGVLFNKAIKAKLFHLQPICVAWAVGGVVIIAAALWLRRRGETVGKDLAGLTLAGAAVIGAMQCLGMIPGTSRSLVTILGGLAVGLNLSAALEFSFLLGLVTLTAATVHDGYKHGREMLHDYSPTTMAIGFVAAAVSAFLAVRWMIRSLRGGGLAAFGVYRILLAAAVMALIASGRLIE
ncbi:MAG: undecaprenyl-diphosphate phosphatase [Gemmataceae bacterium]